MPNKEYIYILKMHGKQKEGRKKRYKKKKKKTMAKQSQKIIILREKRMVNLHL